MNLDDTKEYKKIGLSNYNDFILDLYDANPIANLGADYPKKLKLPESSAGKSEKPKSTTLVKETLRLRNTALLNVKLKQKIFKWEKERFSQLKPYLPPDGTGEGSRTVINLNDEDDLGGKFKIPRFPKIPLPSLKFKPKLKTAPKPAPVLQEQPAKVRERAPVLERERTRQRERTPSFPRVIPPLFIPELFRILPRLIPRVNPIATNPTKVRQRSRIGVREQPRDLVGAKVSQPEVELARTFDGEDVISGGDVPPGSQYRRIGGSGNVDAARPARGEVDPSKLNLVDDSTTKFPTSSGSLDDAMNAGIREYYESRSSGEIFEELKKLEKIRAERNISLSSKNKMLASETENILQRILEKRFNLDANLVTRDVPDALPGTNPVTQGKLPAASNILPFDKNQVAARNDAMFDIFMDDALRGQNRSLQDAILFPETYLKGSAAELQSPLTNLIGKPPLGIRVLDKLSKPKVRAAGFAALDVGFTALDFAQRKGSGQTNLQAGVGAGGGLVGGMVAQGITAAALTKLAAASAITPIPGARPLALLLLLGAGMMGSMAGGNVADSLTGVNAGQEPKIKRNRRGRPIKSKPTPTQAPTAVEELPINSSEELEDEMIKEAFLSGALLNSGGAGMIQYVPVPFEVPVTVKVPVIPSSHWGYTLNGG